MGATSIDIVRAVQSKTLPSSFKANLTDDLRSACYSGNFEECYHIVHDKSCDVNDRADGKGSWRPGATPLHIAAARGHTSIISVLLEFRADTSIKDKAAEIPLHVACCAGHTNAVQMLLEAERAKPVHVRKSELNHDKPRVRARDLTNKGRFRLPATTTARQGNTHRGLVQTLDQLHDSNRDFQSNCCASLQILGQPCECQVAAPPTVSVSCTLSEPGALGIRFRRR